MNETSLIRKDGSGAVVSTDTAMQEAEVKAQVQLIQRIMRDCMIESEHYGVIPGCGSKPALLKAGAEKLAMTFRLSPKFDVTVIDMPNGHREYRVVTSLTHIITGAFLGEGLGSCSTMESKYRYRKGEQTCPICGMPTIIKGKKEYGGGWLCYQRKGGCGAKFEDGDPAIQNQDMGRLEYSDPADYYNTALKMGKKRSLVDAILTATAASDIFEQDIEEDPELFEKKPGSSMKAKAEEERTKLQEIKSMLMQMAQGEEVEFLHILKTVSIYHGKDKKEYWATSIEDLPKREKWIDSSLAKAKEKYGAWACKEKAPEQREPTGKQDEVRDNLFQQELVAELKA